VLHKETLNGSCITAETRNARKVTLSGTEISILPADDLIYAVWTYIAELARSHRLLKLSKHFINLWMASPKHPMRLTISMYMKHSPLLSSVPQR
jgi:hypothetical protein